MTQTRTAIAVPIQYVIKIRLFPSTPEHDGWVFLTGLDADTTVIFRDYEEVKRVVHAERRGTINPDPNSYVRAYWLNSWGDLVFMAIPIERPAPAPF